jgi:AcrR family transcriptional regulator
MSSHTRATKRRRGRPPATASGETRARILCAARRCFADSGYGRATNRQIADAAGVTAAALYNHFRSKAALFIAVFEEAQEELVRRYRLAAAREKDTVKALCAIVEVSAQSHAEDPSLTRFMSVVMTEARDHEDLQAAIVGVPNHIGALLCELVLKAQRERRMSRSVSTEAIVEMLVAAIAGLALATSEKPAASPLSALHAFRLLLGGTLIKSRRMHQSIND